MKWKLGSGAGIGVYVHWSFWILPAWIMMSAVSGGGGVAAGAAAVLFVFAIFGCVVLHEFGHALMARAFGIGTRDITLYPIGGVARLERMPRHPGQEFLIAIAGPAVNVVIAGLIFLWLTLAGIGNGEFGFNLAAGSFLTNLMMVNIALVIFNMLPAFPMDGGRVLRAVLAMKLPYERATEFAARVGQGVAILLGIAGLMTGGMLIFVALFVFLAAQAELTAVRMSTRPMRATVLPDAWDVRTGRPMSDSGIVWVEVPSQQPPQGRVVTDPRYLDRG